MGLRSELLLVARGWRWTRRSMTPRSAVPWTSGPEPKEFPTAWARTSAGRLAREVVQQLALRPALYSETRPQIFGLDRLEGLRGPVVFVSNHASHLDAPLVLCTLPTRWRQRTAVGAAADYFFDARWRAVATAVAFNAFPVERRGGKRVTSTALDLLDDGWSLLLFPEGSRSPDGWMSRFRHGAARLCCYRGVPAVPVVIRGSYRAMPRGRRWPVPGRPPVAVRYGPPVYPEDGEASRAFSARLADAVARLWDEHDTTWWESLRRRSDGRTSLPGGPEAPDWRRRWESTRRPRESRPERVWRRSG